MTATDSSNQILSGLSDNEREIYYLETLKAYRNSEFAKRYFELWKDNLPVAKLDAFLGMLAPGAPVLDAGCGPGHHTAYMQQAGFRAIGIDLSQKFIEIAASSYHSSSFVLMDMTGTTFDEGSFDGIWSCASAIHLFPAKFEAFIYECHRIIAQRGVFCLTLSNRPEEHLAPDGRYFSRFSGEYDPGRLLSEAGFLVTSDLVETLNMTTYATGGLKGLWRTLYGRRK